VVKIHYPKITIVTPSYNQGQYIEQTICSVLDQNYPNFEYIIIDGGSTDNTVDIIKYYANKQQATSNKQLISYWVSEPDHGQAHAINKGLDKVTGDVFNWLNSDDYYEKGALLHIGNYFANNPETEVLCGFTRCFFEKNGATSHTYRMGLKKSAVDTLLNIEMNQPGTFYRTNIVKKLDGINESLRYVFDNELWMKYLCKYGVKNIKLIDNLIAHFRLHSDSKSIGDGYDLFNREQHQILFYLAKSTNLKTYLLDLYEKNVEFNMAYKTCEWNIDKLNIHKFHAWFADKYMLTLFNQGKKKEARHCILSSIKNGYFKLNRKNMSMLLKTFLSTDYAD
jgi:glycosyltransferase involved in cell wall biosynthesis